MSFRRPVVFHSRCECRDRRGRESTRRGLSREDSQSIWSAFSPYRPSRRKLNIYFSYISVSNPDYKAPERLSLLLTLMKDILQTGATCLFSADKNRQVGSKVLRGQRSRLVLSAIPVTEPARRAFLPLELQLLLTQNECGVMQGAANP